MENRRLGDENDTHNCMSFWYPRLLHLNIPTPKTALEEIDHDEVRSLLSVFDGGDPPILFELKRRLLLGAAEVGIKPPFFLRAGYTSGKHGWKNTCYVEDAGQLDYHIVRIAEFCLTATFMGLPINTWAIREMIKTKPICRCKAYGNMPVTEEWRVFVRDGVVEYVQPYWPPDAVREGMPDCDDWEHRLEEINVSLADSAPLWLSRKIGQHFGGYWSVDWLRNHGPDKESRPWLCIDMALGDQSFKWDPGYLELPEGYEHPCTNA